MATVDLADNFSANIRRHLERTGMSQGTLAELAGIHIVTMNRILNGRINPTIDTCERIALAAGIPAEKLFRKPA